MKTSIGLCGATGKTPELQIGQVKTVDYTQKASVEITGTRENPVLNFNIPKGKDGAKLIVREYFNGDIQILNNLNELPEDTNSDSYGKTVMSVNGIKQLLEKINDVLTKANANTNAIGSLTSTVQANKSDIETKLNNFKSDTDTRVQSINQSISELEQTIETKLNEELTKQVEKLQDENKKLNDMIFENSLKESFEGSDPSISDASNGVLKIETIKGKTIVTDAPTEENPNYKLIESVGDKENNKISVLSHNKNLFDGVYEKGSISWGDGSLDTYSDEIRTKNFVSVKPNKQYILTVFENSYKNHNVHFYDINKTWLGSPVHDENSSFISFTTPQNCYYIKFRITIPNLKAKTQLEEGTQATTYEPYKQDKKEISFNLDGGLKSLPNGVCDTIEQREDGFYLVQRVGTFIPTTSTYWQKGNSSTETNIIVYTRPTNFKPQSCIITNHFNQVTGVSPANTGIINAVVTDSDLNIRVSSELIGGSTVEVFKSWAVENNLDIYYELLTPTVEKIDLNTIELQTFKDLTYVTTENNIKPVLKGQATKDITIVIKNLQSKGAN